MRECVGSHGPIVHCLLQGVQESGLVDRLFFGALLSRTTCLELSLLLLLRKQYVLTGQRTVDDLHLAANGCLGRLSTSRVNSNRVVMT